MFTRLAVSSMLLFSAAYAAEKVLIVADEFPAMEVLAAKLKAGAGAECEIVAQNAIPADIQKRPAVIVYIHKNITEPAEVAFIDYAKQGGKLILLHHSISSGKRPNKYWLPFLGVELPTGDFAAGGYKYYEGITMDFVNLAPKEYVTNHGLVYDRKVEFKGKPTLGFELDESEVYLNHVFTTPKHVLLGLKFLDKTTGKMFEQPSAGWYEQTEKGWVFYFMAGHSKRDFENPKYAQVLVNALNWAPGK